MSNALEQLQLARRNPAGQISIAASAGIMAYFMPDILRRYVAAFPEIRVTALQGGNRRGCTTILPREPWTLRSSCTLATLKSSPVSA